MQERVVKLVLMEIAELERMESATRRRLMTSDQRSARLREIANMRRIEQDRRIRRDPKVTRAGLAEARAALREGRRAS